MDRLRSGSPVYGRQMRGDVSSLSGNNPPGHRRSASVAVDGGVSGVRRTQNAAAKAAAERLAQVMASQSASDDGDDEEDGEIVTSARRYGARRPAPAAAAAARRSNGGGTGVSLLGRSARSSSPAVTASQNASVGGDDEDYEYKLSSVSSDSTSALRYYASPPATLPSSNGRVTAASLLGRSTRSPSPVSSISANENEDYEDKLSTVSSGTSTLNYTAPQPAAMASSNGGGVASSLLGRSTRSPSPALVRNLVEHTSANRSTSAGRPLVSARPTTYVPSSKMSLRTSSPTQKIDPPADVPRKKRFPLDLRETGVKYEASTLQDELDILQEENENILGKLQFAEERCEEAEARARELEKQVAALGEGVSLEARLLSRKEAALRQREADFKSAKDTRDGRDEEILMLKQEVESAKVEVATSIEQLKEAESESQDLRSFTQRMILTQEEMEEVVLKRCWLARYWGLAVQHGIYPDIAASKHELWSSLAPLPHELVISAGQKAKEESHNQGEDDSERRNKLVCDLSETGEGNIESMLSVEMGLKELASLKVEDAIVIALAQHRRANLIQQLTSDFKAPGESKFFESFELNQEEAEDVTFKQAWLIYFWRRAKTHGAEEDIAEERLQFWIARSGQKPTSHDAIDVERGLTELRKLGIEQQLWEASRREIDQTPSVTENA